MAGVAALSALVWGVRPEAPEPVQESTDPVLVPFVLESARELRPVAAQVLFYNPSQAEHPAVLEAATIGVPHERTSESVKSFAVLRPGASADPAELVAHCRANLAAYKVPRELELVAELPRSSVLKVLRRELRERELGRRRRDPLEA